MAFLFAYFSIRICRRFFKEEDDHLHRGLTLAALYIAILLLLILLVSLGVTKLGDFIRSLPTFYKNTLEPYIGQLETAFLDLGSSLPESISSAFSNMTDDIFEGLKSVLSNVAGGMVNITTSIIKSAPETLVSIIVTIVSSFYMIFDYENIARWFTNVMPEKMLPVFFEIKDFCENTLFKVIGSYAMIMGLTFLELFLGLALIGISNSGMWAFIISFLDILPILGVGTVLIPWGISCLITGKVLLGIEILAIYLMITVVRNIVEPKLVGTNLGIHPLATLIAMITGLRLFNVVGMFGLPLTLSFFVSRDKEKRELLQPRKEPKNKKKKKKNKKK
jgi:sporulation integral membrane protein YtvI